MATEKRLIDANKPIAETESIINFRLCHHMPTEDYESFLNYLKKQPTVDAVEVVHGRWIVRAEFNNGERVIAACSNCNDQGEVRTERNEWGIWHIDSPYCPNCGAKMDGDGNEDV